MTLAERLSEYISACFTGLWLQSHEHEDAIAEIAELCRKENWHMAVWDVEQGLQIPGQANGQALDAGGSDPLAAIRYDAHAGFYFWVFQAVEKVLSPKHWAQRREDPP